MLKKIEEEKLKDSSKEAKRAKTGDDNFSHSSSDGHVLSKFRIRFSCQGSSNDPPKFNKYRVSNPKTQGGNGDRFHCLLVLSVEGSMTVCA